jgi:hypothetical protein
MKNERPLDAFDRWMVKQNIEHAKAEGLEPVVARLKANGYHRVALAVEKEWGQGREGEGEGSGEA